MRFMTAWGKSWVSVNEEPGSALRLFLEAEWLRFPRLRKSFTLTPMLRLDDLFKCTYSLGQPGIHSFLSSVLHATPIVRLTLRLV